MASKDTFESHTFLANTFAAGAFRGLGVTPSTTLIGRWANVLEITSSNARQLEVTSSNPRSIDV